MNEPLETHDSIVGNSGAISSLVSPIFYGVILVLSTDIMQLIFCIPLLIFFKYSQLNSCDGLNFITSLN